jgi:hypothetical protein
MAFALLFFVCSGPSQSRLSSCALRPPLQALPNETSPHYTLATQGLAYAGGVAADLLFHTTDCLCSDDTQKWCIDDPDSRFLLHTCCYVVSYDTGWLCAEHPLSVCCCLFPTFSLPVRLMLADMYYADTRNG